MNTKKHKSQVPKLLEADIRHFDKLIHDQDQAWLEKHFSKGADEYPVNTAMLMRNIIWQLRERIIKKEKEPLGELIRTFWYMYIKPTLYRAGALNTNRDQYIDLVSNMVDMVIDFKLMNYRDIGFRDENETQKSIGLNYNIILFAEKSGHWTFLQEIHKQYQINVISLGGQPSVLSCEYFVEQLKKSGAILKRSFYLFSIVDYDPSGWIIRDAFIRDLNAFGIKNIKNYDFVNPDMLKPEEINHSKYQVPNQDYMKSKNEKWIKQVEKAGYKNQRYLAPSTNLQTGKTKYFGLEAESISTKRLNKKIDELVAPLIGKSEKELVLFQLKQLNKILKNLLLVNLT